MKLNRCITCPFNEGITDKADKAQNYGCLPSAFDILQMKDNHNVDWICHSSTTRICVGLSEERSTGDGIKVSDRDDWAPYLKPAH